MNSEDVTPTVKASPKLLREMENELADDVLYNDDGEVDEDVEEADEEEQNLSSLKFGEDIKILLIPGPDWRVICHFLGVNSTKDVAQASYSNVMMIGSLMQECLRRFMDSKKYDWSGEIMFDQNGNAVPCGTRIWEIHGKEIVFTNGGYVFFSAQSGKIEDNIAFHVWEHAPSGQAGVSCYARNMKKAKEKIAELEAFTKKNNCIRGGKLRDVNMSNSTFTEVKTDKKYTWENYYFPKHIKDLFDLEVFGFIHNTERYNKVGINKRGVLMHGPPGTGKTTIGHLICNSSKEATVIWITPDLIAENNVGKTSIKLLYMLADFVAPSVIVLEDLDLFSEDREGVVDQLRLGALMNILDGVNSVKNAVTVATTNRIQLIEKALSNRPGRFDSVVEVPALGESLRTKMFRDRFKECKLDEDALAKLVKNSDGWTGAVCQEFVNRCNLYFINRDEDHDRHVTLAVVDAVLKIMQKMVVATGPTRRMGLATEAD